MTTTWMGRVRLGRRDRAQGRLDGRPAEYGIATGGVAGALAVAAFAASCLAAPLAGQQTIDELRPLQPGATVTLHAVSHSVRITTWDRNEVQVQGSYDSERETFTVQGNARSISFRIEPRDRMGGRSTGNRTLEVRVPADVRLETGTVSGSIEGRDLAGSVTAETVSGSVRMTGLAVESVRAHTVSGSVRVTGRAEVLRAATVSGGIEIEADASDVHGNTVSGSIEVRGVRAARVASFNSVSGRIDFRGGLAAGGDLNVEAHSGSVELTFVSDVDARFRLETFSGSIRVDLPGVGDVVSRPRFGPGSSADFTTGSARGSVRVNVFSGTIRVRSGG